jgi:hypothetical protein
VYNDVCKTHDTISVCMTVRLPGDEPSGLKHVEDIINYNISFIESVFLVIFYKLRRVFPPDILKFCIVSNVFLLPHHVPFHYLIF